MTGLSHIKKLGIQMNEQMMNVIHQLNSSISDIQAGISRLLEAVDAIQNVQRDLIFAMSQSDSMPKLNDYPPVLKTKDVAKIMGISQPKVYDIIRRPDFPAIREGRLIVVPRDAFFQWLQNAGK